MCSMKCTKLLKSSIFFLFKIKLRNFLIYSVYLACELMYSFLCNLLQF